MLTPNDMNTKNNRPTGGYFLACKQIFSNQ